MKLKAPKIVLWMGLLMLFFLIPNLLRAQMSVTTLSGTITNASGTAVPNAEVSVTNTATGQAIDAQTNSAGAYEVQNLSPGQYAISVSANGFATKTAAVTLSGPNGQTLNISLSAASAQQVTPANKTPRTPAANLPNAPSGNQSGLSLQSLGFSASQTQGNAKEQALLNEQVHMLKIHQRLGLIAAIPMLAALITGPQAKAKGRRGQTIVEPTSANLDFHMALGSLTTGLYWTTAFYALTAPKIPGVKPRGAIRLHRDLAWIHAPGMILTPILGIMAYRQENAGEKVHGIASAHGTVAMVTAAAYGASIVAISWPIHWKFWEKQ